MTDPSVVSMFDSYNTPIIFISNGNISFNQCAIKLFGYSNMELNSLDYEKIIQFHNRNNFSNLQNRMITITRNDGTKQKVSSLCFQNDNIEAYLLFKNMEHSILEENIGDSGKILSMIYENTSDAMALINVDDEKNFSILSVNQTFTKNSGLTKEKCIGKKIEDVFPASILSVLVSSLRLLVKNKRPLNTEVDLLIQNENRYFKVSLIPILNKESKCVFVLIVSHDLTERKKKEDELLRAKYESEESSKLKATLLANMSHEVRTPLTGILGLAELLEEELDNPEHLQFAQSIRSSGKRLLHTLNSIIELSRLEGEKTEIYNTKLDLKVTLYQLLKRFQPEAEIKGLSFEIEINVPDISLHLDSSLFNQIMANLIDNAIKFTKTGGVKIVVENEVEGTKSYVVIKLIDTGIGISKNNLKTIFKEFKQESEGLGRSHEGMGLGLSLVKRMTELMSGTVLVQSEKYKGSTFILRFPTFSESVYETVFLDSEVEQQTIPILTDKQIPDVLLVEDNELNSMLTKIFLKDSYNVDHASEANTALKLIKEKKYDAVLMDINLGDGMNGIDALNEIRKFGHYRSTPVVAITGYAIGADEQNFLNCGFTAYIAKPFEKSQLLNILDEVLAITA